MGGSAGVGDPFWQRELMFQGGTSLFLIVRAVNTIFRAYLYVDTNVGLGLASTVITSIGSSFTDNISDLR